MSAKVPSKGDVFPDMHHKMSKKIAQLTKVIYHLNTINENNATEVEALKSTHDNEIQQIIHDASARIKKMSEAVEKHQAIANLEAKLATLKKKYENEKDLTQSEFLHFKSQASEREKAISFEYEDKFIRLHDQIKASTSEFQRKIDEVEVLMKKKDQTIVEERVAATNALKATVDKYESELADVVRSSNDKFQFMLIEQLGVQESLKKDHQKALQTALSDASHRLKSEFADELDRATEVQGKQHAEMLHLLREEMLANQKAQRKELMDKQEKLLVDLQARSKEVEALKTELSANKGKATEDGKLTRQHEEAMAQLQRQMNSISSQLTVSENEAKDAKTQLRLAQEDLSRLQSMLLMQTDRASSTDRQLQAKIDELVQTTTELNTLKEESHKQLQQLQQRLIVSEQESASLRGEVNSMGQALAAAREELKVSKQSLKSNQDLERLIAAVSMDKEALNGKLRETMQAAGLENSRLSQAVERLERALEESTTRLTKEKEAIEATKVKEVQSLQSNLAGESQAHAETKASLQAQIADLEAAYKDSTDEAARSLEVKTKSLKDSYEGKLLVMSQSHDEVLKKEREASVIETNTLKATISALEAQVQTHADQYEAEKALLRSELGRSDEKAVKLTKELENKKQEYERAESIQTGLKRQVDSLREELKMTQDILQQKLEQSLEQRDQEWQKRIEAMGSETILQAKELEDKLVKEHRASTEAVQQAHRQAVDELAARLSQVSAAAQEDRKALQMEIDRMNAANELLVQRHASELADISSQTSSTVALLKEQHALEVEAQMKLLKSESEDKAKDLVMVYEDKLAKLRADHDESNLVLKAGHEAQTQTALKQHAEEIAALNQTRQNQQDLALQDLKHQLDLEMEARQQTFDSEKMSLLQEIANTNELLKDALVLQQAVARDLENEQLTHRNDVDRMQATLLQEHSSHVAEMAATKVSHEKQLAEMRQMFKSEQAAQVADFSDELDRKKEKIRSLQAEFSALEAVYLSRESRHEDVVKIMDLQRRIVELEGNLAKKDGEIAAIKRDMLNREETYNQKFGSKPVVGVMQVVKSKDKEKEHRTSGASAVGGGGGGGIAPLPSNKPSFALPSIRDSSLDLMAMSSPRAAGASVAVPPAGSHMTAIVPQAPPLPAEAPHRRGSTALRTVSK